MEASVEQRRVRFSGPGQDNHRSMEQDNKAWNWFSGLFSSKMGEDYDPRDIEFATAAAAAAFSIRSLEETEVQYQRKMREGLEASKTKMMSKKEDTTIAARVNRKFSKKDSKLLYTGAGDASISRGQERKTLEGAFRTNKPSQPSLMSPAVNPTKRRGMESQADVWEKAEIEKIRKWNEKMKSTILSWESDKKMRAKRQMEKRKAELEQRKARNMQHYQNKIVNIENVAGGAIVQVEERTRSKEAEAKEKAKKMRGTGKVPAQPYCFCFSSWIQTQSFKT